jgi:hypothetical protein
MSTIMYFFKIYLHVGLISPTKSSPHFINGYFGRFMTNFDAFPNSLIDSIASPKVNTTKG